MGSGSPGMGDVSRLRPMGQMSETRCTPHPRLVSVMTTTTVLVERPRASTLGPTCSGGLTPPSQADHRPDRTRRVEKARSGGYGHA